MESYSVFAKNNNLNVILNCVFHVSNYETNYVVHIFLKLLRILNIVDLFQKKAVPESETVDRDVIWQSVVRLVDDCLMEQMRQKREIDKNLEDSLYSSIRDLVKTLLPPVPDEGSLLNCDEVSDVVLCLCYM